MKIPINHKVVLAQEVAGRLADLDIPSDFFSTETAEAFARHGHVLVIDERGCNTKTSYLFHPKARVKWGTYHQVK